MNAITDLDRIRFAGIDNAERRDGGIVWGNSNLARLDGNGAVVWVICESPTFGQAQSIASALGADSALDAAFACPRLAADVPCLDGMPIKDLKQFSARWRSAIDRDLRMLVGDRTDCDPRKVVRELALYADVKANAMYLRTHGDLGQARIAEGYCDRIYDCLPSDCRW